MKCLACSKEESKESGYYIDPTCDEAEYTLFICGECFYKMLVNFKE